MHRFFILTILSFFIISCNLGEDNTYGPTIYFSNEGNFEITPNDTLLLSPRITYNNNSTYIWKIDNDIVSTELEYQFIPNELKDYNLSFIVMNDNGTDTSNIKISVVKKIDFESFDNFSIKASQAVSMVPDTLTNFISKGIIFSNSINQDTTNWYGFAFSNKTAPSSSISINTLGCAYDNNNKTANYLVANCYEQYALIDFGNKSYSIKSIDIANDNFVYLVSKFGYTSADSTMHINYSTTDDVLTLKIIGLNSQKEKISEQSYNLIDCRYNNQAKFFRLNTWHTEPLYELGNVNGLLFEITSTQEQFPKYVCIDNIKLQDCH